MSQTLVVRLLSLIGSVSLALTCAASSVFADSQYHDLNYRVYQKESGSGPSLYFQPEPNFLILHDKSAVATERFPLEPLLKAGSVTASLVMCTVSNPTSLEEPPTETALANRYQQRLSIQGDWNGDGLTDLLFIAKVQQNEMYSTAQWCAIQLINRGRDQAPVALTSTHIHSAEFDLKLALVDRLQAIDINNDGRDDLVLHYDPDRPETQVFGSALAFYANGNGELFGLTDNAQILCSQSTPTGMH